MAPIELCEDENALKSRISISQQYIMTLYYGKNCNIRVQEYK